VSFRSNTSNGRRQIMFRVLTILAAIAALAVSAAPASAGLLSSPLGVSGAMGTRSGGEVVSDFARAKPKPAVYDHGLTQGATNPRTVAVRPPVGFIFDLSLVR
jgi:hypothetical protein